MQQATKRKKITDYTDEKFTRCWTCRNATGGCTWSHLGEPVKGWTARSTFIPSNGQYAHGYFVVSCLEYIKEKRGFLK